MDFIEKVKRKAKGCRKTIVLAEGTEGRTLKAADIIVNEGIAEIILLGDPKEIHSLAYDYYLENIGSTTIINPLENPMKGKYVDMMVELRGNKGMTAEIAGKLIEDPLYLGVMMVKAGDADGEVAGARSLTGDVLRPALEYIKTAPDVSLVSGMFLMSIPDTMFGDHGIMIFADCAVNPNPTAAELAEIAVTTGRTARHLAGMEPRIAMLSFSTKGSASHESVDKVVEATRLAREMDPSLLIDGELQGDAAIVPGIGAKKAPGSKIAGKANVLIFPTLDAGNISYKLVQRMAKAEAIGPIFQGLASPVNDLSRGCSVEDIVGLVAVTACQAAANGRASEVKKA